MGFPILKVLKNVRFPSIKDSLCQAPVAHICNPSYLGGRDQEDRSQPGQTVCKTLSQKYSRPKRAGRVAQVAEYLPSKHEAKFNPQYSKKKKKKKKVVYIPSQEAWQYIKCLIILHQFTVVVQRQE
jgi:hypothetical protein